MYGDRPAEAPQTLLRKPPKSAASVALVERPESNQWILLAPWGKRYLRAWRAYERGDGEKPRLADFMPRINRDGGTYHLHSADTSAAIPRLDAIGGAVGPRLPGPLVLPICYRR